MRVVLIGDSIRIGYQPVVAELLSGRAEVTGSKENGGDSANLLERFDDFATALDADVIHFNCGLHDIRRPLEGGEAQVPLDVYTENLKAIVSRLRRETSARLVWATTTPVIEARHNSKKPFARHNADVHAYNEAAAEIMLAAGGIRIDDLYAAVRRAGPERLLGPDGVHYADEGYAYLGERVAAAVVEL